MTMTVYSTDRLLDNVIRVWRGNRCISRPAITIYSRWVQRFISYCDANGLQWESGVTLAGISRFVQRYARSHHIDVDTAFSAARSALLSWREALQTLGQWLPPWLPSPDASPIRSTLLREFAIYLREHRVNPENTINHWMVRMETFLAFLRGRHRRPRDLRLSDLDAYVVKCAKRYAPVTVAGECSMLRSFTRFLRATGRLSVDLAPSILAPVVRKGARPRRALPWSDVQRILRAIDRSSSLGRRAYALLLLMSAYGLGAGEVIRLRLEDIDWRVATLRIVRPKTRVEFLLPLMPAVARVLVNYLRHGRPAQPPTRHLFVQMHVPHALLSGSSAVRHVLIKHARAAGVSAPFLGSHALRHTHASRQMDLGASPKLIGDILGHRDPESTSAYLRIATERLRQIALPVPR
jgi:integrase/recombinase XerD